MLSNELKKITDEELFLEYKNKNDEECFLELYNRYSVKIYSYCLRVLGDKETARDIFQKSWTSVVENKNKFSGGCFIAWLMIITRNNCLMEKRQRKHTDELPENIRIENDNIDFEMTKIIRKEVKGLPKDLKDIIELRYFDEFSYNEISDILNIKLSLVKVRLFRAKKILLNNLHFLKEDYL